MTQEIPDFFDWSQLKPEELVSFVQLSSDLENILDAIEKSEQPKYTNEDPRRLDEAIAQSSIMNTLLDDGYGNEPVERETEEVIEVTYHREETEVTNDNNNVEPKRKRSQTESTDDERNTKRRLYDLLMDFERNSVKSTKGFSSRRTSYCPTWFPCRACISYKKHWGLGMKEKGEPEKKRYTCEWHRYLKACTPEFVEDDNQ